MRGLLRRIRGAVGNAVAWAVSWVTGGTAVLGVLHLTGLFQLADPSEIFSFFVPVLGATGFLTGMAFSTYLSLVYRDQTVLGIRMGRFMVGGAVIAGLICPLVVLLSPLAPELGASTRILLASELWTVVFGSITAGATLKLAQGASQSLTRAGADELAREQDEVVSLLGEGGTSETTV
jgi:hypothetical protein